MKEKELRLALVCYGGVSLAIYMHGVTKEIQKLLYASRQFHNVRDPHARRATASDAFFEAETREIDSEIGYVDILQALSEHVHLRVLVDIIAGASAGGINGILLAQAIAHNTPLDPLRALWLENADVERLLAEDAAPSSFSKFYMRPLVWLFGKWQNAQITEMIGSDANAEMRRKLSQFVRARWFKPPFSGVAFTRMVFDGLNALTRPASSKESLLPQGYPLDLFVTVTDYAGHAQKLHLHSPESIMEKEHRLIIGFHDEGRGPTRSLADVAALTFSARATASFPGAFPAATLAEIDTVTRERGYVWDHRPHFINQAFRELIHAGSDPERCAFIDGSVLNNKPFGPAIQVLGRRPAHREVDRRIVYIEPYPGGRAKKENLRTPGFFSVLRASLSDIPRNQPIRDDLEWVHAYSHQIEHINHVVESMHADVDKAIVDTLGRLDVSHVDAHTLTQWRLRANHAAGRAAGFTYGAYVELKVGRMFDVLALSLENLAARAGVMHDQEYWYKNLIAWAHAESILPVNRVQDALNHDHKTDGLAWVKFLRQADGHYRLRRLRFMIRSLNRAYGSHEDRLDPRVLDTVKQHIYSVLSDINYRLSIESAPDVLLECIRNGDDIRVIMLNLTNHIGLLDLDALTDEKISAALMTIPDEDVRRTLAKAYVGFAFFDITTFPMLQSMEFQEYDEIKVDRISPDDCNAIRSGGTSECLKGILFGSFGAFFSRAYRENDYLWGRLHGADRLIDIVVSTVDEKKRQSIPVEAIKRKIFRSILRSERTHLPHIPELFDQIEQELKQKEEKV